MSRRRSRTSKTASHDLALSGAAADARIFRAEASDAIACSSETTDANGQPVKSFTKAIMRAGAIVRNKGGVALTITRDYLDSIAKTFGSLKAAKVGVPVQLGHNEDGDKTRGRVIDVWREGDFLQAQVELVGDGIKLASTNDVSVYIAASHERDGTVYRDAMLHLAMTPMPQFTGLGPFTPIPHALAASVFELAKDTQTMWKNLAAALGMDVSKLTDETGPAAVEAEGRRLHAERAALAASVTANQSTITTLQASVGDLTARIGNGAPTVDADILDEHADLIAGRIDGLASKRLITPAQKAKLNTFLCGSKDKRNDLCLSATAARHRGLPDSIARSFLDILEAGVPTGGTGGAQTHAQGDPPREGELSKDDSDSFAKSVAARAA